MHDWSKGRGIEKKKALSRLLFVKKEGRGGTRQEKKKILDVWENEQREREKSGRYRSMRM